MRLSDLPADVQAKVLGSINAGSGKRKRPARTEASGPSPYRCVGCPPGTEPFPTFAAWERHSHTSGHRRGEAVT